jgi:SAM-dependent methyltransferase
MSRPADTAARFNLISDTYDETRQPLTPGALDKVAETLSDAGVRLILEAGVGTGRIALPLQQRNFQMFGVDLSRGMLTKARGKGIQNVVLADANHLPLRDGQFDAALMAHVIHLLENPAETFESLRRVATKEIVVLVRKREGTNGGGTDDDRRMPFRETFRRIAAEQGYQLPERQGGWWDGFRKESEFLAAFPPTDLITVEDELVVTTLRERLSFFERRAYGHPTEIPEEAFRRIMQSVMEAVDADREVRFRRVEQMAIWRLNR